MPQIDEQLPTKEQCAVDQQLEGLSVGNSRPPFADISRIAVLRGGGLGDLLFALPAAEALAAAYPSAELTLLGAAGHAALLSERPSPFRSVEVLPAHPGVQVGTPDPAATDAFFSRLRSQQFDLAVQLHGGGRNSNPFLLRLGARHTVGTRTEDAAPLERTIPYLYYQHEVLRALEVVGAAGAPPVMLEPQLRLTAAERQLREQTSVGAGGRAPLVVIHPGATDPRRRWPAAAFAATAADLARDGADVVVVGDASDEALANEVVQRCGWTGTGPGTVASAAGQLSFDALIELFCRSTVVLGNDSGPRHLAQAVGAATVGVYWFGNVINAGPLTRGRHRIQIAWTTDCPVCGIDCTQVGWTAERCEHNDSMVAEVRVEAVLDDVRQLLAESARVA